jgi:hypothetical protein
MIDRLPARSRALFLLPYPTRTSPLLGFALSAARERVVPANAVYTCRPPASAVSPWNATCICASSTSRRSRRGLGRPPRTRQYPRMVVDVGQLVGGALGGALASSILGPLFSQRSERRNLRADVLRAVGEVERRRWTPEDRVAFRAAVDSCRAAALVAAVNRDIVDRYLGYAEVGRRTSEWTAEHMPDEDGGGSIPSELGDLIRITADVLVDHVWHPHRSRWSIGRNLRKIHKREENVRTSLREQRERVDWSPTLTVERRSVSSSRPHP